MGLRRASSATGAKLTDPKLEPARGSKPARPDSRGSSPALERSPEFLQRGSGATLKFARGLRPGTAPSANGPVDRSPAGTEGRGTTPGTESGHRRQSASTGQLARQRTAGQTAAVPEGPRRIEGLLDEFEDREHFKSHARRTELEHFADRALYHLLIDEDRYDPDRKGARARGDLPAVRDVCALFRRLGIFSLYSDQELPVLVRAMRVLRLGAGEMLFEAGKAPTRTKIITEDENGAPEDPTVTTPRPGVPNFYAVLEGTIEIQVPDDKASRHEVKIGQTLADEVLASTERLPYFARAVVPSTLAEFSPAGFQQALKYARTLETKRIKEFLRSTTIGKVAKPSQLSKMAGFFGARLLKAGDEVWAQEVHGKCFAVLHTGELELHRVVEVWDKTHIPDDFTEYETLVEQQFKSGRLLTLGPSAIYGHGEILGIVPEKCRLVASKESEVFLMTAVDFKNQVCAYPDIRNHLILDAKEVKIPDSEVKELYKKDQEWRKTVVDTARAVIDEAELMAHVKTSWGKIGEGACRDIGSRATKRLQIFEEDARTGRREAESDYRLDISYGREFSMYDLYKHKDMEKKRITGAKMGRTEDELRRLPVAALKTELTDLGLKADGKKAELAARLSSAMESHAHSHSLLEVLDEARRREEAEAEAAARRRRGTRLQPRRKKPPEDEEEERPGEPVQETISAELDTFDGVQADKKRQDEAREAKARRRLMSQAFGTTFAKSRVSFLAKSAERRAHAAHGLAEGGHAGGSPESGKRITFGAPTVDGGRSWAPGSADAGGGEDDPFAEAISKSMDSLHRPKRPAVVKPKQQIPVLTRSPTSGAERVRKMVNINLDKRKTDSAKKFQSKLTKQMTKLESPRAGFWATDLTSPGGVIDESHIDKYLAKDLEDTAYSRGLGRTGNLVEKKQFYDPKKTEKVTEI